MAAKYHVGRVPQVSDDVRSLSVIARVIGRLKDFVGALRSAFETLNHRPSDWGDPLRKTARAGGMVYRGIRDPLVVHFALYEREKEVMVLKLLPLPHSFLDTESK